VPALVAVTVYIGNLARCHQYYFDEPFARLADVSGNKLVKCTRALGQFRNVSNHVPRRLTDDERALSASRSFIVYHFDGGLRTLLGHLLVRFLEITHSYDVIFAYS
jgi:hypothetical protein